MNRGKFSVIASSAVLLLCKAGCAQGVQDVPVPSGFSSAQTVFLASAGAPALGAKEKLAVSMVYSSMYQHLSAWNRYKLTLAPERADLAFEISLKTHNSDTTNGNSFAYPRLEVVVRDVKTHILLWTLDEPIQGAFREKTFQRNVDDAVVLAVEDLKALAQSKLPSSQPETSTSAAKREPKHS